MLYAAHEAEVRYSTATAVSCQGDMFFKKKDNIYIRAEKNKEHQFYLGS